MESSRLVRLAFAALIAATMAAFFLTQSLKTEVPVVLRFATSPLQISPNGDGVRDSARVGFDLSEPTEGTLSIIDEDGNEVRRLVDERSLAGDVKHRFTWNGRDDEGGRVPDGVYRMRLARRKEGRIHDSFKTVRVDTAPPRVRLTSVAPGVVDPSDGKPVAVRAAYAGPSTRSPEFLVWRTDDGSPRVIRRFRGGARRSGIWDGRTANGAVAQDGDYALQVRVRDKAGNEALAPAGMPTPEKALPGTGVAVRRFTLRGPLTTVAAGSVARLRVGPAPRRFEYSLARLGSSRAIKRDRREGGVLRVGIPADSRTGVYVVSVRWRGRTARWPLAVDGVPPSRRQLDRPRPLVVLPVITWQGLNRFDSDLDGFVDTLRDADAVPVGRPFAGGHLPPRLGTEAAPLLRFLDRERIAYDLTTDLSLVQGSGPSLGEAPGLVVPGSAIWLPRRIRERLLKEVEVAGKPVAVFGGSSLRRSVALVGSSLRFPSPERPDDLFGERTRPFKAEIPAPLNVESDRLGLFEGIDGLFGEFALFERSVELPDGARLLSAAGREPGEPAFVAYRLGKGTVIRMGTPEWAQRLEERSLDVEVPRVTRRIWRLLSGG
jgi:hypothetical protein